MPRIVQQLGRKGSQKWLQVLVNEKPGLLTRDLVPMLGLKQCDQVEWLSPLKADAYAEYSDDAFLKRLKVYLPRTPLEYFWPKRGPVWDGLGRTNRGDIIMLEAKAHIAEMVSPPTSAGKISLPQIRKSLDETKHYLGSHSHHDWASAFYQYTNRLAHLYFLRVLNGLRAYLIFLHFLNATDMAGPTTREEWDGANKLLHIFLGINHHKLSEFVVDAYVDVNELMSASC
jgi:hypothetical protein